MKERATAPRNPDSLNPARPYKPRHSDYHPGPPPQFAKTCNIGL